MTNLTTRALRRHRIKRLLPCLALVPVLLSGGGVMDAGARENARRAPLNIIPQPTTIVAAIDRRAQEESAGGQALPQLAPGGLSMRRPLRNVAALPGGQGLVQVGTLGNLEDTDIGLTDGLGTDLWQASRMSQISRNMLRLPKQFQLQTVRQLAYELMITRAAPPPGLSEGSSFFTLRLEYLLALGESEAVLRLVEMTGADQRDAATAILATKAILAGSDVSAACKNMKALSKFQLTAPQADFLMQLRGYCQTQSGDMAGASLTLDLARETGMSDTLYMDMLLALTAGIAPTRTPDAASRQNFSIMQTVMMDAAKAPIFKNEVALLPPVMLPRLVQADYHPVPIRLLLAERAVQTAQRDAGLLLASSTYLDRLNKGELPNGRIAGPRYDADADEVDEADEADGNTARAADLFERTRLLLMIDQPDTLTGKVEALRAVFQAGRTDGTWPMLVEAVAPYLMDIAPSETLADFAGDAVPALLWLGDRTTAQRWLDVLMRRQGGLPTALTRRLDGLMRLAEQAADTPENIARKDRQYAALDERLSETDGAVNDAIELPPMEAMLLGAVLKTGPESDIGYVQTEISLLPVFDFQVPEFLTEQLPATTDRRLAKYLAEINAAFAGGERGNLVLLALAAMGYQDINDRQDRVATGQVLLALKQAGLGFEARQIARDLMILQAASLPVE